MCGEAVPVSREFERERARGEREAARRGAVAAVAPVQLRRLRAPRPRAPARHGLAQRALQQGPCKPSNHIFYSDSVVLQTAIDYNSYLFKDNLR